jgi:hypothetical protein|tara:strand:+ start:1099 stop:2745 length:1647 start_codon:yes stop_codon:yes gene_type:complete
MEYDIENILSMYEDDYNPGPRPMAQGGRIGFSNGGDTSPVYNEKTGHIYKKGNRFGIFYSKTPPKNQFTAVKPLRSLEELQLVIDEAPLIEINGKFFEQNAKDLEGRSEYSSKELISRKELDKYRDKLNFKSTGKKRIEETNQGSINRRNKIIAAQGSEIPIKGGKQINRAFSHVYPIIESAKPGTKTTTVIDADMNNKLIGYNRIGQKIAEDQEYLLKVKPEGYKKQILVNNAKAKKNVMNALQDLGKDYKGQIGYFQVDPETESFKPKAGNYKMSFAGVEGKDEIYKDMTSKERQDFSKKISKQEHAKVANKLKNSGFKCKLSNGLNCNDPRAYIDSIKENMAKVQKGDDAAISKINKLGKSMNKLSKAAKFTGWGILTEVGFAAPFAAIDYAKGANKDEIISNATFGLFGKSKDEQLREKYNDYGQAADFKKTYDDLLTAENLSKTGGGYRTQAYNKLKAKDLENKLQKDSLQFTSTLPPSQGFKSGFDSDKLLNMMVIDAERDKVFDKEKEQKSKERGILKPSTGLESYDNFMQGGIASLNVKK